MFSKSPNLIFKLKNSYLKYEKTYWERHGIPSSQPHWFFGHSKQLAAGMHVYDLNLSKKYETYG